MDSDFAAAMSRALEQTRAGNPTDATRTIQAALGRQASVGVTPPPASARTAAASSESIEDAEIIEDQPHGPAGPTAPRKRQAAGLSAQVGRKRQRLRDVVKALSRGRPGGLPLMRGHGARPDIPDGARYEGRRFACHHGAREYRLYVPTVLPRGPQGLVVMLHGCTQNSDDFACGTGMNEQAERHGLIVAYPHQTQAHNAQSCWNWFRPGDQQAGAGEPAILAELARELASEFSVDPSHVFAAGISAGGAMAAILGAAYPEIFSGIGVHSGLPQGAAHDVVSAFAAMRGEGGLRPTKTANGVRTIAFHGSADATVHPSNARAVIAAAAGHHHALSRREQGTSEGGRSYTREVVAGADGTPLTELWHVEGVGHAWSGGRSEGTYTDPTGPDASRAMVRFFLNLH